MYHVIPVQDEGEMRYWADNVFAANHWDSHCSALGANVHIIGVLLVRWRRRRGRAGAVDLGRTWRLLLQCTNQHTMSHGAPSHRVCMILEGKFTPSQ